MGQRKIRAGLYPESDMAPFGPLAVVVQFPAQQRGAAFPRPRCLVAYHSYYL
jgi:hypothetical protein